jgi:peptide/nickel transport system permease protein
MGAFIVRRLLMTILVVVIVSVMIFLVMRLLPGDPIYLFISESSIGNYSPETIAQLKHDNGLDRPLIVQYFSWIGGIFHGDFGKSIQYQTQISDELKQRMPVTFTLGFIGIIFTLVVGIPLGIIAAIRRGKWQDTLSTFIANIGITVPIFWLGILGIFLFGMQLNWLPIFGYVAPWTDFVGFIKSAIMPLICLSIFSIASVARQTRSALLEVIHQDYIRTAWAKGLEERRVIFSHALKNSLIPVVTLTGFQIRSIIGGSVLVETVFNIPGMGRLMAQGILTSDYAVVQSVILLLSLVICLANLLVDIAYGWVDPRIRLE